MKKISLLCTLFILLMFVASHTSMAQSLKAMRGVVNNGYNFWLYSPAKTDTLKPVVIFLHGASLCGHNMNTVRKYGTIDAVEKGRMIDGYVIAPQNPGGAWKSSKIKNVLDWVVKNYKVDTTRVYVLGMSLGGYGTIDFAATYPQTVAAAMAFCGGGTRKNYCGLTQVPLWIVHGTADRAVSVRESDKVVNAMKKCDGGASRLHYDRVAGMNHGRPARIFYLKQTYDWLFKHRTTDVGRPVAPKFAITGNVLSNAYRDIGRRKNGGLIK